MELGLLQIETSTHLRPQISSNGEESLEFVKKPWNHLRPDRPRMGKGRSRGRPMTVRAMCSSAAGKPGGLICTFVHEQTVLACSDRMARCGTIRHTAATDNVPGAMYGNPRHRPAIIAKNTGTHTQSNPVVEHKGVSNILSGLCI